MDDRANDGSADGPFWDLDRYKTRTGTPAPATSGGRGGGGAPRDVGRGGAGPGSEPLVPEFAGSIGRVLGIALMGALLSILTLSLYRFWLRTNLRRAFWGAIVIDGDPLEYTGRGLEKLLGFLLALVVLAVYLAVVNLGLTFVGLSIAADDPFVLQASLQLSLLAAIPLIFYATYRGQRYVLARTRWRGIRFGLAPGAWGYAGRAMALSLLTIVTLGLAWPYQQFRLAKYITDRASFGDLRFRQEGSYHDFFHAWVWLYILLAVFGLVIWGMVANPQDMTVNVLGFVVTGFGGALLALMYLRYRVIAFRALWSHRSLGDARFENTVTPGRIIGITILGNIAVGVITAIVGAAVAVLLMIFGGQIFDFAAISAALESPDEADIATVAPALIVAAAGYLMVISLAFALAQALVTLPILGAQVRAMTIHNPRALEASLQREADRAVEAGGFADALGVDVGAGL